MKLHRLAALAWFAVAPALAGPVQFNLTFERTWSFFTDVSNFYSGGTVDGATGPNVGVTFTNVYALSNTALETFYSNAPSPLGVVTPFVFADNEHAYMNLANGASGAIAFFYSSPTAFSIQAFSGIGGAGSLLGTIDLAANTSSYDIWTPTVFVFNGLAGSFDLTNAARAGAAFDNFAVPEPETVVLLAMGGVAALCLRGRRRRATAVAA